MPAESPDRPRGLFLALDRTCLGLFLAGLILICVFATWSDTTPYWYGVSFISLAAIGYLFAPTRAHTAQLSKLCLLSVVLFTGYILTRAAVSPVKYLARQDFIFCTGAFLTWLLVATRFTRQSQRLAICVVFALLIFVGAGIGIYQYFVDPTFSMYWWAGFLRAPERSAGGFFESGNHFAGFLELTALPLLGVALHGRLRTPLRIVFFAAFLAAAVSIVLSTSRGGLLSFGAGCAVIAAGLVWTNARSRKKNGQSFPWGRVTAVVAVVIISGAVASSLLSKQFKGAEWTNLNTRNWLWALAGEQWQQAPWLGTGARSYEYVERSLRTMDSAWLTWNGDDVDAGFAHSDFLQLLAEYGAAGLGLGLLVLTTGFWTTGATAFHRRKSGENPEFEAGLALGCLGALSALGVHSIFDFNLHIGANTILGAVVLGIAAQASSMSHRQAEERSTLRPGSAVLSFLAVGGAVVLLAGAAKFAAADWNYRTGRHLVMTAKGLDGYIRALGALEKAVRLDPGNPHATFYTGVTNMQMAEALGQEAFYKKSLTLFNLSLQEYPQNPYAAAKAGKILDFYQRYDEAEIRFQEALRWGSGVRWVYEAYGDHLRFQDRCFEALQYYSIVDRRTDPPYKADLHRKMKLCQDRIAAKESRDAPESP